MIAIFQNKRIKIFKTLVVDDEVKGVPGKIKATANSSLQIYTGRGLISILELQQEGKKCLPIDKFLRGTRISDRDYFN